MNDVNTKTGAQTVRSQSYLASLPERTARAGAALAGGLVYEATEVVFPDAVRRSKLYQAIVGRLLRIMMELVGGVEGVYPTEEMQAADLPDAYGLEKIFSDLQSAARQGDRSVMEISSVVALGAVRAGVQFGNLHVFDYYRGALRTIVEEGLLSFLRRTSTPYLSRADSHFDPASNTYSERLLRRWANRRSTVERKTTPHTEASDEENAARE